ncbi:MAG: hypothetical protein HC819_17985 [Cyclobacteriaceae bacterium]|nr:hypothetical protein [Cyclobacteriaceae bacterium]
MRRFTVAVGIFFLLCNGVMAQDPREQFKFAKFKYDNNEYEESLKFLNLAIAQDSTYVSAYYLRSEVYYKLAQYYNAILDINHIFKIERNASSADGSYYLARAKAFLGLKDLSNARQDIEKAFMLSNDKTDCYYYRAKLNIATNDLAGAIKDLDAAIKINPQKAPYLLLRAETKTQLLKPVKDSNAYAQILEDYNNAIALEPKNHQTYLARSNFLNNMGESEKALKDYNMVIEMSPKKEEAYAKRGIIKMNNYDYRGATLDFTRSILISPNEESNYRYRGLCYNNLNNYNEAFKDFSKSIDLLNKQLENSADKEIMTNVLAETYLLRGHCLNLMGNNAQACRDFLMAHNLGVKKGLNYYRKYCGIY